MISHPSSVIATVCSQCAAYEPSLVLTVQSSRSTYVLAPAFVSVIIGSMASVMPGTKLVLKPGMTLAIEPMITLTKAGAKTYVDRDDWTVRTKDGSYAAHWEHTVAITDDGCEIMTLPADYP